MSMFKEFRDFAARGNVIDLAVGVIIGAAFGKVVTSAVNDLIMPPIGMALGRVDFSNLFVALDGGSYASVAQAKAAVTAQLRNPGSARFRDVKLRTVAGKQAVCGLVNARNSRGFMTGPQPFAYDGEQAYLIVFNPGPANFTSLDANSLIAAMGGRLRSYNRLCR